MGLHFGMRGSISKNSSNYESQKVSDFDPNPKIFKIKKRYENNGHTVIWINYPNCINYEGSKIIVFKNTSYDQISNLKEIDPHFTEKETIKPFARFEPTTKGWSIARKLLSQI